MLKDRTAWARAAAGFGRIAQRDNAGHVSKVTVPGHEAKTYDVILRRSLFIEAECLLNTGIGHSACQGNSAGVCYHAMAAVIMAGHEAGYDVRFAARGSDANRLRRLGYRINQVRSRQSGKTIWAAFVVRKAK